MARKATSEGNMEFGNPLYDSVAKVSISESGHKIRMFISVLMDSPFYLTLSVEERYSLLKNLVGRYPSLFENEE
ncbi:MAG: hypothetical protein AB1390_03730 [Nitrospirota bacterium]